ncbi:hypothetical protein GCM10007979_12140 [Nocardioides albus]|nr:hypothetical protein GCM10007979_12140 [Nocardioides albus]
MAVVVKDELAVAGAVHVELDIVDLHPDGLQQRLPGVVAVPRLTRRGAVSGEEGTRLHAAMETHASDRT